MEWARRMRRGVAAAALVASALTPAGTRADLLFPGDKGVRLSIKVSAKVPRGKALLLTYTFRGAMVIKPGTVQEVSWHPFSGGMQLRMISASRVEKIEKLREELRREYVEAIARKGAACHERFDGVRTISDKLPETEIRWHYNVAFKGDGCQATLKRTEKLGEDGEVLATVKPGEPLYEPEPEPENAAPQDVWSDPREAKPGKGVLAPAPEPADTKPEEPEKHEPVPAPAKTGTSGDDANAGLCDVSATRSPTLPLLLVALVAVRRRRR